MTQPTGEKRGNVAPKQKNRSLPSHREGSKSRRGDGSAIAATHRSEGPLREVGGHVAAEGQHLEEGLRAEGRRGEGPRRRRTVADGGRDPGERRTEPGMRTPEVTGDATRARTRRKPVCEHGQPFALNNLCQQL